MWYLVLILNGLLNVDKSDITTKTISTHFVLFCLFSDQPILHAWKCESQSNSSFGGTQTQRASEFHIPGRAAVRHGKFLGAGFNYTCVCTNKALQKFTALGHEWKTIKIKRYWQTESPDTKDILYAYCLGPEEECSRLAHFLYRYYRTSIVSRFGKV